MSEKQVKPKSQSQKIRAVLYLLWQKNNEGLTEEEYYFQKTEKYLDFLKKKLDDVPTPTDRSN